jgi:hypothetical protein
MFFQCLGGIIGISIAGTIFTNQLSKNVDKFVPTAPKALVQASIEVNKIITAAFCSRLFNCGCF